MAITIEELVAVSDLGCRILAGHGAAGKAVAWAHVCELSTPWEWLGAGDLVMTTGLGIPERPADQVAYVRGCAEVGIVGVAIGEDMSAPPLSNEMLAAADDVDLCVVGTSYAVPFVAISRTVVHANQLEERDRLRHTMRVYETVRQAIAGPDVSSGLVAELADALRLRLYVIDVEDRHALLPAARSMPTWLHDRLRRTFAERSEPMPAMLPLRGDDDLLTMALAIPGYAKATLVVEATTAHPRPDPVVLQHVAYVAALELARRDADRERERRTGSALLAQLVDGSAVREAEQRLVDRGFPTYPWAVVAAGYDESLADLHHPLADRRIPHLLLIRAGLVLLLVPDDVDCLAAVNGLLTPTGVSAEVHDPARVAAAATEARRSLELARSAAADTRRYGVEDDDSSIVPRRVEAAQALVERVLSALFRYDREHRSELVRSLRVFLEENRSWNRAADRLKVHKQTLVYRMNRVTELTGRRTDRTHDVAELWVALRAHDAIRLADDEPVD